MKSQMISNLPAQDLGDLLSIDDFFGEEKCSALPSKNKAVDEKKLFQQIGKFSSATLFLEIILFTEIRQIIADQNNK